jgi:hypothetical protein
LVDGIRPDAAASDQAGLDIRQLAHEPGLGQQNHTGTFTGFTAITGWGQQEGPVPEAFLPPFHWGYAPASILAVDSAEARNVTLFADLLTYSENQTVDVELNGTPLHRLTFTRINQRERLQVTLPLRLGRNELHLRYNHGLVTAYDARQLAVIFLSLRIVSAGA